METSPNITKRTKDVVQSECPIPEEAELADALGNTDPNANWGAEPNFNLNLTLTSPSNPRPATETSKLHGATRKDHGNKGGGARGAVATETGKSASALTTRVMSPRERDDPSRPKSQISALSRSPTAEALVNSKDEQRLKLPNPNRTPSLSPMSHAHSGMAASPKPQVTIGSSPRTTDRVKSVLNPKPHVALTTKTTNKITVSPKVISRHDQKGDLNVTHQTPTITAKPQKPDPASTRHDLGAHSSEMPPVGPKSPNQRVAAALHSAKTPQPSSLNAKPSTQRKASGTRNSNASGSKENLDGKDSSLGSGSKTTSKSSSISKATTKESLDSKASPNSKTAMGSKDSLSSKSGSASKTSWGSRDSLDSKTGSNSKASPNCKSGMGSRDSLDSKTATEIKATKTNPDSKTVLGLKSGVGSKDNLDPKTQSSDSKTSLNLRNSPSFKHGSELNPSSNSDVLSRSKPGPTHSSSSSKPSLMASGSKMDLVGPDSLLLSGTCLFGSKDNNLRAPVSFSAKPSPDVKAGSDSSKPGPVRSSSKPALADLSPSLVLSPTPSPATSSPGSDPGKALGSSPAGPNGDVQRSPGSGPGSGVITGLLDPLATSSPKTRTTVALTMMKGSTSAPAEVALTTSRTSINVSLTRGLTFDSITKTSAKTDAAVDEEHLKLPETKVRAPGEPAVSQEAMQGADGTENMGRLPGDRKTLGTLRSKPSQLGDGNAIAIGSNIPSPRARGVERKKEDQKKERGKPKHGPGSSSSPSPSSSSQLSTHPASSKTVRETATMTSPSERLHLQGGERREVGVQVEVVECSNCRSGAPSSLIGSPSCKSGSLNSPTVPSLCCTPAGHPPLQHVCKIDIELCSQLAPPSVGTERASSLPSCLRSYSFQQSPPIAPELQLRQNQDCSVESIWEDEEQEEEARGKTGKPQEVTWDQQGRTWEVYGASVDLESLGTAIQSHLESKIREQEKHIRTLRKSTCSDVSLTGYKRKKKRGRGILGCCVRTPNGTE